MKDKSNMKILIIDDDVNILDSLQSFLEAHGFSTDIVSSGYRAIKRINEITYNLILSDIDMPIIDGLEILSRLKSTLNSDVPVILMTGHTTYEYAIRAIQLGAVDFIGKPLDSNILLKRIEHHLQRQNHSLMLSSGFQFIDKVQMHFTLCPKDIVENNIPEIIMQVIHNQCTVPAFVYNELQLCLEEMVNNAFIHGCLTLSKEQRDSDYTKYVALISELINREEIASKRVYVLFDLNNQGKTIKISVTDEGNGYDYESVLAKHSTVMSFDTTGRGIRLISELIDKISFSDNGRTVTIEKSIP